MYTQRYEEAKQPGRKRDLGNYDDPPRGERGRDGGTPRGTYHPRDPQARLGRLQQDRVPTGRYMDNGRDGHHGIYFGGTGELDDVDVEVDPRAKKQNGGKPAPTNTGRVAPGAPGEVLPRGYGDEHGGFVGHFDPDTPAPGKQAPRE